MKRRVRHRLLWHGLRSSVANRCHTTCNADHFEVDISAAAGVFAGAIPHGASHDKNKFAQEAQYAQIAARSAIPTNIHVDFFLCVHYSLAIRNRAELPCEATSMDRRFSDCPWNPEVSCNVSLCYYMIGLLSQHPENNGSKVQISCGLSLPITSPPLRNSPQACRLHHAVGVDAMFLNSNFIRCMVRSTRLH